MLKESVLSTKIRNVRKCQCHASTICVYEASVLTQDGIKRQATSILTNHERAERLRKRRQQEEQQVQLHAEYNVRSL